MDIKVKIDQNTLFHLSPGLGLVLVGVLLLLSAILCAIIW